MHLFLCLFKAYATISSTLFKPKLQWCFGMFFVSQLFICRVGMWLPSLKATLVMYRQTRRDLIALTVVSLATSSPAHVMARSDTHTCFDLLICLKKFFFYISVKWVLHLAFLMLRRPEMLSPLTAPSPHPDPPVPPCSPLHPVPHSASPSPQLAAVSCGLFARTVGLATVPQKRTNRLWRQLTEKHTNL